MGRSTSPITARQEPSKAFMIREMGFTEAPPKVNFIKVVFGMTFNDDPVSTNTRDSIVSIHFTEMCRALLCVIPSMARSSSTSRCNISENLLKLISCYILRHAGNTLDFLSDSW